MPRRETAVKNKHARETRSSSRPVFISSGLIDIHFHGAFGIDLMTATEKDLDQLAALLWKNGITAFCPTTLSSSASVLKEAAQRLGGWTKKTQEKLLADADCQLSFPLGLHLEGPFINPDSRGAHPDTAVRPFSFEELDGLWQTSQGTLKILTIAPETLSEGQLEKLTAWASEHQVTLSLGHSKATHEQAFRAFEAGFRGVTHAWNALSFHHRQPGALGAAIGRKDVYLELIADQIHVDPVLIDWTCRLHGFNRISFVSDCVTAAATQVNGRADARWYPFGPLQVKLIEGACRTPEGHLAGGGLLVSESYGRWLVHQTKNSGIPLSSLLKKTVNVVTDSPLWALKPLPTAWTKRLRREKVAWIHKKNEMILVPVPASS